VGISLGTVYTPILAPCSFQAPAQLAAFAHYALYYATKKAENVVAYFIPILNLLYYIICTKWWYNGASMQKLAGWAKT